MMARESNEQAMGPDLWTTLQATEKCVEVMPASDLATRGLREQHKQSRS
jgi:hypothetical protein